MELFRNYIGIHSDSQKEDKTIQHLPPPMKGEKYWIKQKNSNGKIEVYFGKLINLINKNDIFTKTALDFPKLYVFEIEEFNSTGEKLFVNSTDEIYPSYLDILNYCLVNKIPILFSVSAISELVKIGKINDIFGK